MKSRAFEFKPLDLTTVAGRIDTMQLLNKTARFEFMSHGIELNKETLFRIGENYIEISIKETNSESSYFGMSAFGSEITISRSQSINDKIEKKDSFKYDISYGSSGNFDPSKKDIGYLKTIHAASLIKNWDTVIQLMNAWCDCYIGIIKMLPKQ
jgi:hypothetical protein